MKKSIFIMIFLIINLFISVNAGILNIMPMQISFQPGEAVTTLILTNPSTSPILIQLNAMYWTQQNGEDQYAATDDLLITPPMFEIPAEKTQLVRIALQQTKSTKKETNYRIYLREIIPKEVKLNLNRQSQLNIALNIAIPVFVMPSAPKEDFVWSVKKINKKDIQLTLVNRGNTTLRVSDIELYDQTKKIKDIKVFKYLQSNEKYTWNIPIEMKLPTHTSAIVNGKVVNSRVQIL